MLRLEDLVPDSQVDGIDPSGPVNVVAVESTGPDATTVFYRTSSGRLAERLLFRSDESSLAIATVTRSWRILGGGKPLAFFPWGTGHQIVQDLFGLLVRILPANGPKGGQVRTPLIGGHGITPVGLVGLA